MKPTIVHKLVVGNALMAGSMMVIVLAVLDADPVNCASGGILMSVLSYLIIRGISGWSKTAAPRT
ncbi:hypothetical protein B4N89_45315 [Embleya scabrispora]|uniref:Uncharacterized protein n=1 Tax=Embleya scabrispora TaxID=159449 RepID=A0A1T3NIP7_9ACTN|nr:hypothetical protein [Embleya scabrispora]OPC76709.1 hypothetical protein B4N89_45315 [Embleya scabrispora]